MDAKRLEMVCNDSPACWLEMAGVPEVDAVIGIRGKIAGKEITDGETECCIAGSDAEVDVDKPGTMRAGPIIVKIGAEVDVVDDDVGAGNWRASPSSVADTTKPELDAVEDGDKKAGPIIVEGGHAAKLKGVPTKVEIARGADKATDEARFDEEVEACTGTTAAIDEARFEEDPAPTPSEGTDGDAAGATWLTTGNCIVDAKTMDDVGRDVAIATGLRTNAGADEACASASKGDATEDAVGTTARLTARLITNAGEDTEEDDGSTDATEDAGEVPP